MISFASHSTWFWNPSHWSWESRERLDHFLESTRYAAIAFIIFTIVMWAINRFTDGIFPTERRLARELREKAERYKQAKKSEKQGLLANEI